MTDTTLFQHVAGLCVDAGLSLTEALNLMKKAVLTEALHRTRHNHSRAALLLRVHRNTLARQMKLLANADRPQLGKPAQAMKDKLRRTA